MLDLLPRAKQIARGPESALASSNGMMDLGPMDFSPLIPLCENPFDLTNRVPG